MTRGTPGSSSPDGVSAHPGWRPSRRWWLAGGLAVVLLMIGVVTVYAMTRNVADRGAVADEPAEASAPPSIPAGLLPTDRPVNPGRAFCRAVQDILNQVIGVDLDYAENRRSIAGQLRELDAPTPRHQAARDELADEFDAAAQMVEDDPAAELEALDRDRAAQFGFLDAGGCDPV
jgi:hypothetical protein